MLFNSIEFAIFLPVVFILYWFITNRNLRLQNLLLLVSSYIFYAWWDWRFLFILFFISLANYSIGLLIQKNDTVRIKKIWLISGIIANIGVLSYFKYFDFFIDGFINLFSTIGLTLQKPSLNIILPLGISFYIFLSLSYIIDIYQNKFKACGNIIDVLLTLSFFPIILAGPIQRPVSLLPQIQKKRIFDYNFAVDGLRQILWGLFMKIVIADNCAVHANNIFQNYINFNGSTLLLGGVFYTIQIYADFAGYSEIAIGVSKLFGFELMRNFAYPYFSRDITEFWRRWHISLTTWFRDYIYLPIAYSLTRKISNKKTLYVKTDLFIYIISISITWVLTGLWHGANYTFIVWGFINGFLLIVYQILKKPRKRFLKNHNISNNNFILTGFEYIFTLLLIIIAWIVFRSENIGQAFSYISGIFSISLFSIPQFNGMRMGLIALILSMVFLVIEWIGREQKYAIAQIGLRWKRPVRYAFYYAIIVAIFLFTGKEQQFIYFQF